MIRNILVGVLAIALVGSAFWGYQEHKEKNAILINAENNYQRAFHDLSYQVDILHDKIGNTLAMNSRNSLSPALTDVWRITSEAQIDVGQLPLTLMPFNKTEEFLSDIGSFSYRTGVRDLEKDPLNDKEYARLQTLHKEAGEIQDELRKVQYLVIKNNLRWMDVETALASNDEKADNTIIDGFKTVEKKVEGYSETANQDPNFISGRQKEENFSNLKGKEITKKEAVAEAKRYANLSGSLKTRVEENGKGSDYGFYSVSLINPATKTEVNMDITKVGGYPIWYINNRKVDKSKIDLNSASNKAVAFLKDHDFDSLDLYESAQYGNIGMFNFVTSLNGVRIYPDSVKVKIALDNGSVVGFSADEFLKSNKAREIGKASKTIEQARAEINPKVKIMEERKALIENELGEEVLCYEFLGTIDSDTYRIFINANTVQEERVEKLKNAEPVYENLL
ncbi:germination protein YpeB [Peribacillus cavernae]|uniref:Germination protein YpeB n=1 Tax=Peribacillus cavernae TaxID=1674310 RepID=A0A3S0U1R8_9BACI|nr:germination protein YpeB [Peribacillus cavernae]MDQ0219009.1 spore germination protein [Peribacillus cavernae]RUQ29285.1 germination protein YpeB [Peribacillus cavernae]